LLIFENSGALKQIRQLSTVKYLGVGEVVGGVGVAEQLIASVRVSCRNSLLLDVASECVEGGASD
jgi:hypothetical protein